MCQDFVSGFCSLADKVGPACLLIFTPEETLQRQDRVVKIKYSSFLIKKKIKLAKITVCLQNF